MGGADREPQVLVVGAGPAGLILAHELLRRGIPIRLVERREGPSHTTRAFTLHARTMEMFEHMGVAHRLEQVCLMCPGNVYHFQGLSDDEKPRTDFRTLPSRFAFYYKLNQNDFEQVLRDHLLAHYAIRPEYRTELVDLSPLAGSVRVSLRHRDTGETETTEFPWIVGCDGAHSRVRQGAGIAFPGQRVGVMAMMDVEVKGFPHDDSWVNYFIAKDVFMLVTKLPGRYWRVYLSDAGRMTQADNPRASFQAVADEIGIGMTLGDPQWATQWEILNNIADRYREGRVLICGDASHVHSPAGGQGMNGCMQDAFNLGWKLASVVAGRSDETVLDSYERERKPIGEQITLGAKSTHEIVMAFGKGLEDRISITRAPDWQANTIRLISGLSHNYRDTVSIPEGLHTAAGPRPGERAPDALLVREPQKRVFDLFRHPYFTLLLVPARGGRRDLDIAQRLGSELEAVYPGQVIPRVISPEQPSGVDIDGWVADETGEFARAYGIESEGRLILVRPDMYIGLNAPLADSSHVITYLRQWLRPDGVGSVPGTAGRAPLTVGA